MEARALVSRGVLFIRFLNQRNLQLASHPRRLLGYDTHVNPQPSLDKPFEGQKFDLNAGPPGPVHPKVKQLQKLYQTVDGRPVWRKTHWDDLLYGITLLMVGTGVCYSGYAVWYFINPKPAKGASTKANN